MQTLLKRAIIEKKDIDILLGQSETYTSAIDDINSEIENLEKFKNEEFPECLLAERTETNDLLKKIERSIRSDTNNDILTMKYKIITNIDSKIHNNVMPHIRKNIRNIENLDKKVAILERVVGILSVFVIILIAIMVGVFIV